MWCVSYKHDKVFQPLSIHKNKQHLVGAWNCQSVKPFYETSSFKNEGPEVMIQVLMAGAVEETLFKSSLSGLFLFYLILFIVDFPPLSIHSNLQNMVCAGNCQSETSVFKSVGHDSNSGDINGWWDCLFASSLRDLFLRFCLLAMI